MELDAIWLPEWARAKAIAGLTVTDDSVWLGRIAARALERLDREAGGNPQVTSTAYRPCPVCGRPLLGEEAEARWELDKGFTGRAVPCGPECLETKQRKTQHAGT